MKKRPVFKPTDTPNVHQMTPEDVGHMATCLCCYHFNAYDASPGYSEYTPGSPASIYCGRDHFEFDEYDAAAFFKRLHDLGATCPDFEPDHLP